MLGEFKQLLESYTVVPEDEKKLYAQRSSTVTEPMKRRELKIAQFKKEKEIKTKISVRTSYYSDMSPRTDASLRH